MDFRKEINLIDMIVSIMLRWRILLISMLVGAVWVGLVDYYNSYQTNKKQSEIIQNEWDEADDLSISETERTNVENVIYCENLLKKQQKYGATSIWMNLDYEVYRGLLIFTIEDIQDPGDDFDTKELVDIYIRMIEDGTLARTIGQSLNINDFAANELIRIRPEVTGIDTFSDFVNETNIQNRNGNILCINTFMSDEDSCNKILDQTEEYVKELNIKLNKMYRKHRLVLLDKTVSFGFSQDVYDAHNAYFNKMAEYEEFIAKKKDLFSDIENRYYKHLIENDGVSSDLEINGQRDEIRGTVRFKYILLGFAVGPILCAIVLAVLYIFSSRIRFTDDPYYNYGINSLGYILDDEKWNSSKFRKWLLSLREFGNQTSSREVTLNKIKMLIKSKADDCDSTPIVISITADYEKVESFCNELSTFLADSGIKTKVAIYNRNNTMYINEVSNCATVIIVGEAGVTEEKEILSQIRDIKQLGREILGMIIIE